VPLYTATMVGSIADQWRGSSDTQPPPLALGGANLSTMATLFAAWMFFVSGAPAEIVSVLALAGSVHTPSELADALARAPRIAVSVALPVIAAGALCDVAGGLLAKSSPMAPLTTLISAMKSTVVVFAFAIVLPRAFALIASSFA